MLTNKGLARLNAHTRATTTTRERNRVAVPRTYTVPATSYLSTQTTIGGIITIRHESGLTASAFPDGSYHSGTTSVWRAWNREQRAKGMGR